MDPQLTSAPAMSLIGLGTVFVALVTLVWVVRAVAWLTGRAAEPARSSDSPVDAPARARAEASDTTALERVALAAYALHLRRRGRLRDPEPLSHWAIAGRARQLSWFGR